MQNCSKIRNHLEQLLKIIEDHPWGRLEPSLTMGYTQNTPNRDSLKRTSIEASWRAAIYRILIWQPVTKRLITLIVSCLQSVLIYWNSIYKLYFRIFGELYLLENTWQVRSKMIERGKAAAVRWIGTLSAGTDPSYEIYNADPAAAQWSWTWFSVP